MNFTEEFLSNKVFCDQALTFDPLHSEIIDGKPADTGAIIKDNGDVFFRIYAPNTKEVMIMSLMHNGKGTRKLILEKQGNGMFEGTLSYIEECTGPSTIDIYFDGTLLVYPYIPVYWTANRPCNFVEIPDYDLDFMMIKNVPHGAMSREIYWAHVLNTWERCNIYTPPGYMNSDEEYPVLYLLNGGGDNEMCWEYSGRVAHILDNSIAEGKTKPFIAVMNNGMLRHSKNNTGSIDDAFERMLIESCIPYIEKTYRVKKDKWNRAIAGLSMGSFMTSDIGFKHPDLFGYMGHFTASMTEKNLKMSYERPYPKVMQDAEKFAENYKIYYRSTTRLENHFEYFEADDELCAAGGIDKLPCYHRKVYSDTTSKWSSWRMGIRDFSQLIFK